MAEKKLNNKHKFFKGKVFCTLEDEKRHLVFCSLHDRHSSINFSLFLSYLHLKLKWFHFHNRSFLVGFLIKFFPILNSALRLFVT